MRLFKMVLSLALLTFMAAPVFADNSQMQDSLLVSVTPVAVKTIELKLGNLHQQTTQIMIQNLDGSVTYFTDYAKKKNTYRKKINLKELVDGKYLLVINHGNEKKQQVIVMKEGRGMLLSDIK